MGNRTRFFFAAWIALTLSAATGLRAQPPASGDVPASTLLAFEGQVEVRPAGAAVWSPATTNQALRGGDRVRTGRRSRVTLRLSDLSVTRVGELTSFEIRPPPAPDKKPLLDVLQGWLYFFNRERPREVEFRTPQASGAVRGTEFHIFVGDDGQTVVTVLDGEVVLTNALGEVVLRGVDQATVPPGQPPRRTPVLDALGIIQWSLYYPATLDPDEAALTRVEKTALAASLRSYRQGDLLRALAAYPEGRVPASDAERVYLAALLLAVGQVSQTEELLAAVNSHPSVVRALRTVIRVVKGQTVERAERPSTATEWLAEAYRLQSQGELQAALEAAQAATRIAPSFGFAWVRVAELDFGFGRANATLGALTRALELSPRNAQALALQGFVLAAQGHRHAALEFFDRAIATDGSLGNGWLGRGLVKMSLAQKTEGRADLQVAAALEPQRALLRSYLGKAFSHTWDNGRARKELALAQRLDPNDPTAWFYSALLAQEQNEINRAVSDLERSRALNDHRNVWRSRLLLDQDRAVRSANLASIYRDAGMTEVSVREAARAVNYDYGNYSAHQFLANSYDALRDPRQVNLRYEAPWLSELLTANLLAPPGAGNLSQNVSQQEYSRLFESDHLGVSSSTEYFSSGDWLQRGSQYGSFGRTGYALDAFYRTENGQRPNNDLEQLTLSAKVKQQLTAKDSLFFQFWNHDAESGDVAQYYYQTNASLGLRLTEKQDANLVGGYHREWGPGSHTLFLAGWFNDRVQARDTDPNLIWLRRDGSGEVVAIDDPRQTSLGFTDYAYTNRVRFEAVSAEVQHLWQTPDHLTVVGARGQFGWAESRDRLEERTVPTTISASHFETDINRASVYGYHQWQVVEPVRITLGATYDRLHYPENLVVVPITDEEATENQFSPKAGVVWEAWDKSYFRLAYTRSLGGVFFDNSVRLEPTQVAGFNQAFRSLLPESAGGLVPATEFETLHAGWDWAAPSRTYVGVEGEWLRSDGVRTVGVLTNEPFFPFLPDYASSTRQALDYEERSALLTVNQLLGEWWSLGGLYRFTAADLDSRYNDVPEEAVNAAQELSARLHQARLLVRFHHPSGFFAQADTVWSRQSNAGYTTPLPEEDFWQFNLQAGYRFLRRRGEVRVGLLNLTDQNYRLNPLTLYAELPRERTFFASLRFYF
ncbi:MAG TPA: FecR domain-containing protein [Methylomirabilota bacterium]|nr:FecR domain-containing protein [Methylomirabilota bacterium]